MFIVPRKPPPAGEDCYTARLLGPELEEVARAVFAFTAGQVLPEVHLNVISLRPNYWELPAEEAAAGPPDRVIFKWNGECYDLGDGPIYIYLQQPRIKTL